VKVYVIDAGPNKFVEEDAGKAIIDASPAVCTQLFGVSSCGWSDHFGITAVPTSADDGRELGPFNVTVAEYEEMIAAGEKILEQNKKSSSCVIS